MSRKRCGNPGFDEAIGCTKGAVELNVNFIGNNSIDVNSNDAKSIDAKSIDTTRSNIPSFIDPFKNCCSLLKHFILQVSPVNINHINTCTDEDAGTPVAVCEKVASIQKSNGLPTLEKEKEKETSVSNKTSTCDF